MGEAGPIGEAGPSGGAGALVSFCLQFFQSECNNELQLYCLNEALKFLIIIALWAKTCAPVILDLLLSNIASRPGKKRA